MAESSSMQYQQLVEFIQSAEAEGKSDEGIVIDIDRALSGEIYQKEVPNGYSKLLELIESTETGRQKQKEEPKEHKEVQEHIVVSGLEQAKYSNPSPIAREEEEVKKDLAEIKDKISGIVPKVKEIKKPRAKSSDLVLPTLSLTDQIAELERVIEGIKEGIFDEEHLEIVKLEVFGLHDIVEKAERKKKRAEANGSEIEGSLVEVRNQRLEEAIALLQNR
ncbi:MAG: hypothetical protein ACP5NE_02330 [Candidatus Micrarchaeia archaeon]